MGALLLSAAALWVSSRLAWSFAVYGSPGVALPRVEIGAVRAPALVPIAVLAVAGIGGTLATSGWPRRIVGILLVAAGLVAAWLGIDGLPGTFGAQQAGYPRAEAISGHLLALMAGAGIVLAGLMLVRAGHRMPRLGSSYRTPADARRSPDADKQMWEALSEGEDPTAREG